MVVYEHTHTCNDFCFCVFCGLKGLDRLGWPCMKEHTNIQVLLQVLPVCGYQTVYTHTHTGYARTRNMSGSSKGGGGASVMDVASPAVRNEGSSSSSSRYGGESVGG